MELMSFVLGFILFAIVAFSRLIDEGQTEKPREKVVRYRL